MVLGCVAFTERGARQMKSLDLSRYGLCSCVAAALLAGCGGLQPPIGAPGAMPQTAELQSPRARRDDRGSWMEPNTQSQDLLYVTDYSSVSVFSYPQGQRVGTLTGFRSTVGTCVDSKGDVFITNHIYKHDNTRIAEYAHGGIKPIAELANDRRVGPIGCSVDPTTGNLAVSGGGSSRGVGVDIFHGAQGKPSFVRIPQMVFSQFCGYDGQGDLFVNGLASFSGTAAFVELPKGRQKFVSIKLDAVYDPDGGVQWDGTNLAVGGYIPPGVTNATPVIYQFSIKGKHGTKVGTTMLGKPAHLTSFDFFITGGTAIAPNWRDEPGKRYDVLFYNYPQGGKPTKIIAKHSEVPRGVAVSLASADR
jgi:hypothetical protein